MWLKAEYSLHLIFGGSFVVVVLRPALQTQMSVSVRAYTQDWSGLLLLLPLTLLK